MKAEQRKKGRETDKGEKKGILNKGSYSDCNLHVR